MANRFFSSPGQAIVSVILIYIGLNFLTSAIATGGVVDLLFGSVESLLNSTGFSTLSAMFNTGGAAYLLLGVGVVAAAIFLIGGKGRA